MKTFADLKENDIIYYAPNTNDFVPIVFKGIEIDGRKFKILYISPYTNDVTKTSINNVFLNRKTSLYFSLGKGKEFEKEIYYNHLSFLLRRYNRKFRNKH